MFAGPNGSGKSDLIFWLQQSDLPLGPIVNADIIFDELQNAGFIDLQEFELSGVSQNDWNSALNEIGELSSRVEQAGILPNVEIKEDMLICDGNDLNVYVAAMVSDFVRYMMVNQQISFSFETVMSHPGKIDFLQIARERGYKTYLYFIATDDPAINVSRVKNRVQKGGHSVPEQKINERYERSLDLLNGALKTVDRAYILDNSKRRSSVLFEKKNDGKGYLQVRNCPRWFEKAVVEKLH
jgi:predicted ABC-type ATPase